MRKFLLVVVLFYSLSISPTTFAEIPDGFKGYPWGTDFKVIDSRVNLTYERTSESNVGEHRGIKDAILDSNGNIIVYYFYQFSDNKLVGGAVFFRDKSEFDKAINTLKLKMITPLRSNKDGDWYIENNTFILIEKWNYSGNCGEITFTDIDAFKQSQEQNEYNKYFN